MFLELLGTIFAGIGVAGLVMVLNKLTGGRLPRWTAPVGAGLGMITMTIVSEYGWYGRTSDALPEGFEVVQTVENRSLYRPWTYPAPYVERFAALDRASVRTHDALPDQRLADLYFFGRWAAVEKLPILVDCAGMRRASLGDGATFDARGAVTDAVWISAGAGDPVIAALCGEV